MDIINHLVAAADPATLHVRTLAFVYCEDEQGRRAAATLLSRDEARQWQPKVIAEMNDYQFKVVKLKGDFVWHDHKHTDETFIVIDGVPRIDFRDGSVLVSAGEMFVACPLASHTMKHGAVSYEAAGSGEGA
jgi:mannose-6-phosphate isomerase-like protein (cupin superfamily)